MTEILLVVSIIAFTTFCFYMGQKTFARALKNNEIQLARGIRPISKTSSPFNYWYTLCLLAFYNVGVCLIGNMLIYMFFTQFMGAKQ